MYGAYVADRWERVPRGWSFLPPLWTERSCSLEVQRFPSTIAGTWPDEVLLGRALEHAQRTDPDLLLDRQTGTLRVDGYCRRPAASGIVSLAMIGAGSALLLTALTSSVLALRWTLRIRRDVCPACGYPRKGRTPGRCPECGLADPPRE